MKCPHCQVEYHSQQTLKFLGADQKNERAWGLLQETCPACDKFIFIFVFGKGLYNHRGDFLQFNPKEGTVRAYPRTSSRPPCPKEVLRVLADDYNEACLVLPDSPKASAALSRRCLQHLLREVAKVKPGNLADEIQQVIDGGKLPSSLVDSIDAIRNIGNFAAHPMKSQRSGEVLPVEAGEADWNLDVLESLFDFFFVQPAIIHKKRDALNKKLKDAGKPSMK